MADESVMEDGEDVRCSVLMGLDMNMGPIRSSYTILLRKLLIETIDLPSSVSMVLEFAKYHRRVEEVTKVTRKYIRHAIVISLSLRFNQLVFFFERFRFLRTSCARFPAEQWGSETEELQNQTPQV